MKQEDKLKVKCIIKTLLLIQGPKTAKQLIEFMTINYFGLGMTNVSYQFINKMVKADKFNRGILKDVEITSTKPVKYYIPKVED